ncbi:hypothetical protein BGX28_002457 [Mortierella sp. GBA30]|nr:hypothetical protein BGX28_002457 [Mortierella sp. GBA30]
MERSATPDLNSGHVIFLQLYCQASASSPSWHLAAVPGAERHGVTLIITSIRFRGDLEIADFSFILETIQFYSASQQEFWESMSTLIRYSMPNQRMRGSAAAQDWQRTIAYAISEVFWKHQDAFVQQVERAQSRAPIPSGDLLGPQQPPNKLSDGEILAHTMIESLLATYYQSRALSLYAVLSERGVAMPGKLLESFIRIAVSQGDGAQLERIGNMILTHEEIYQESLTSTRSDTEVHNRPLLMSAKIMDSFVYGACGQQLYDLARAVFDRGLQAGQKYRTSTFTAILNSLSVKEFGFDVVAAAGASTKVDAKRHHARRRSMRGLGYTNHCEAGTAGLSTVTGTNASFSSSSTVSKKIAVTGPEKIEKYIQAMEDQKVKPSMTTLNVLVKLHLEMAQYRVPGAPHWKSVFRRYNPLRLQPDIVTNNTLLTFYEKRKDLAAMRKIYESMARVAEDADLKSKRARRLQRKILVEHGDIDPVTIDQDRVSEEHEYSPDRPHPQSRHVRSNRDIYTYNTMLHALLQHAVETKDIASIGQCFYDMEQDGISADTVTFNANILYHITRSDLSSAIQVFHSMKGANSPSESTLRSGPWNTESFLSTADSRSSRHSLSLSKPVKSLPSTVSMSRRSLSPIENSPKVAISPTAALDFVSTSPPAPDVVTLTALISGFAQAGRMDKASHFFKEMTDRHCIEPNLKTYAALVAGLHRTGDHERAERLWELVLDEEDAEIPEESGLKITKNSDHGSEQVGSEMNGGGSEIPGNDDIARRSQPRHLTIMERLQAETRRKLYRESLQA